MALLEFFLNRWADHDARVLTITSEMVGDAHKAFLPHSIIGIEDVPSKELTLRSLRIEDEGLARQTREKQDFKCPSRIRELVTFDGNLAGNLAEKLAGNTDG